MKVNRNDQCPCGSGKKYKKCCEAASIRRPTLEDHSINLKLGIEYHRSGNFSKAEAIYQQILNKDPNHAEALYLMGLLCNKKGEFALAEEYINKAIKRNPNNRNFYNDLGNALRAQGKLQESLDAFTKALKIDFRFAEAHHNLGDVYSIQGKLQEAISYYHNALRIKPDFTETHNNLGTTLKAQGDLEGAIKSYRNALRYNPNYPEAHNNLGVALRELGKIEEAIESFKNTLRLVPTAAFVYNNLASALNELDRLDEACECFQKAIELKPNYPEVYNNLGATLKKQGKLKEAINCYRKAIQLLPNFAEALNNLGSILIDLGEVEASQHCFEEALKSKPDFPQAHFNYSLALLLKGDLDRGLPEYEWRWKMSRNLQLPFPHPMWNGENLKGKTILLHSEQGFGDTLQFIRYASLVKLDSNPTIIVKCQAPLFRLLKSCSGIDQLVVDDKDLPAFDVQAPLMSLPYIMKTNLQTIPANVPYLHVGEELVRKWKDKLSYIKGLKIGIAWQGNPKQQRDVYRSYPLKCFEKLSKIEGVKLISLQRGIGLEQLEQVSFRSSIVEIEEMKEEEWDFMDTAAVMKNLDLVIGPCSAVVHLGGAIGARVWAVLGYMADWRWFMGREDSPWYPTMKLYRQKTLGDWEDVFERITKSILTDLVH
jgi:tetratricopeptide (TPR) repeat protein